MPFDETKKGDPFYGDFPDLPDKGPWADLAATVQRQVRELAQLRFMPDARHRFLEQLMQRRQSADRSGDDIVAPFDFLPVDAGFDMLIVPDELLLARPHPEWEPDRDTRSLLVYLGLEIGEVDCHELRRRVLRLIPTTQMGPKQLADAAWLLRSNGFEASVSNITPTSPIIKPPPSGTPGGGAPPTGSSAGGASGVEPQAQALRRPGSDGRPGEPAVVAVIDTGIPQAPREDGWLNDVPRDGNIDPLHVFPLPNGDGYLDDAAGHGTFVAGCIQQVAPGADIRAYRAVDSDGIGSEVRVACELIRAVKQDGAQIVNLSVGCQTPDNVPPVGLKAALEIIGEWERETGREVLIVSAAGNFGDTVPCWPAAFRRVVSVAALAPDLTGAPWSTRGPWVTCSTIGQGICSTFVTGEESPQLDPQATVFGPDAWAVWSGTSFSAPQIAGALARLHQVDGYSPRQALRWLLSAGRPLPGFGQALKILPGV